MKPGRSLETLVACLEQMLAGAANVRVESPKMLPDRTAMGELREHDVVLTVKQQHHELLIAIECRDRSEPVGIDDVEGFSEKCRDTGVRQGIIASSSGFSKGARKKAKSKDIRCFDLQQALAFEWLKVSGVELYKRVPRGTSWTLEPMDRDVLAEGLDVELVDGDGTKPPDDELFRRAVEELDKQEAVTPVPGIHTAHLRPPGEGWFARDKRDGRMFPLKWLGVDVEYETVEMGVAQFQSRRYMEKDGKINIADVAEAQVSFGDASGRVVIVMSKDRGLSAGFIEDEKSDPKKSKSPKGKHRPK